MPTPGPGSHEQGVEEAARGLVATLILAAPRGRTASEAHDAAAQGHAATPLDAPHAAPHQAPHHDAPHAASHQPPHAAPLAHAATPQKAAPVSLPAHAGGSGAKVVSLRELRAVMTQLPVKKAEHYLAPLNEAMTEFHITKRLRKAAFLAQIALESHELLWFHELASGNEYDITVDPAKARVLGNIHPGDGRRYKGRGPIQLTGRSNYRAAGRDLGLDLEGHPEMAVEPGVAFRSSGWFWAMHGLNALADQGDFRGITLRINGAYTAYAERRVYYDRALRVLDKGA